MYNKKLSPYFHILFIFRFMTHLNLFLSSKELKKITLSQTVNQLIED